MTNPKVPVALAGNGGHLTFKKADVRFAYLPDGGNGAQAGARRLSCRGGTIDALITSAGPAATRTTATEPASGGRARCDDAAMAG
jgi:hypothetical protein